MTPRYVRRAPERTDSATATAAALTVAAGVGVVVFYLTRLFVTREPLVSEAVALRDERSEPSG